MPSTSSSSTSSSPSSPSTLRLLLTNPSAAPFHRVLDGKLVEKELLVELLNEWIGGPKFRDELAFDSSKYGFPVDAFEQHECERNQADFAAISFMLMDARFAATLYHRYRVKCQLDFTCVFCTWGHHVGYAWEGSMLHEDVHSVRDLLSVPITGTETVPTVPATDRHDDARFHSELLVPSFSRVRVFEPLPSLATLAPRLLARIADRHLSRYDDENGAAAGFGVGLTSIAWWTSYDTIDWLRQSPQLTSLRICDGDVSSLILGDICRSLYHVPLLSTFSFFHDDPDNFDEHICAEFAQAMPHLSQLTVLDIGSAHIGTEGCRALAASLHHVPRLVTLQLWQTILHDDDDHADWSGFGALGASLQHLPHLTSLKLSQNSFRAEGCRVFAASLRHVPQLASLDVSWNEIGDEGCRSLAASLQHVPQLTSLNVSYNCIDAEGCRALGASLQHVPQLMTLILMHNDIGVEGWLALAASLHRVPQLTSLDVSNTTVDGEGSGAFAAFLQHVPQLKSLNMQSNSSIDDKDWLALAASLQHVPQLTLLDVSINNIGAEGCLALAASLQHVPQLKSLDVYRNKISDEGCLALAASVQHVPHLTSLNLRNNCFGDESCVALAAALQHVPHLKSLDVRNSKIGPEGRRAFEPLMNRVCIQW